MAPQPTPPISFGRRLAALAEADPDAPAVILVPTDGPDRVVTRAQLDRRSTQVARLLADHGVGAGSVVACGLGNSIDHVAVAFAVWKVGGCLLPLSPVIPARERDQLLELADVGLTVADWLDAPGHVLGGDGLRESEACSDVPLPDVVSDPGRVIGTGGSTGRPKLIVSRGPWAHVDVDVSATIFGRLGFRPGQRQLVAGPLYHGFGFDWTFRGLLFEHKIVLLERFDAERAVAAIERHRVQYAGLVPTMMRRIIDLPGIDARDLSSLEAVMHTAAPCPPSVKRHWIDLVGPERIYEGYGGAEGFGNTVIRGDEWLAHPGSIGRPVDTEVVILDDTGSEVPTGQVGGIYLRRPHVTPTSPYVGAEPPPVTADGFTTFGDLGWVDADGYVFIADRRTDMIVTGGVNVYPAEVEAALLEHPAISDVVVIGLPDTDWGRRVHAIFSLVDSSESISTADLVDHCRSRVAPAKVPKSWEQLDSIPRDAAGKLRRIALVEERKG